MPTKGLPLGSRGHEGVKAGEGREERGGQKTASQNTIKGLSQAWGLLALPGDMRTEHNVLLVHTPPFCCSSTLAPTHAKV